MKPLLLIPLTIVLSLGLFGCQGESTDHELKIMVLEKKVSDLQARSESHPNSPLNIAT